MKRYVFWLTVVLLWAHARADEAEPWPWYADRIVEALRIEPGERVMLRFDPDARPPTAPPVDSFLARRLRASGAIVEVIPYGPLDDFAARLEKTDVYVWLPEGPTAVTPPAQMADLVRWLDARQERRELHFHWGDGTRDVDGLPAPHNAAYDRIYRHALDIDHAAMSARMDAAIALLRSSPVRVTTPAGTDVRFEVGDRPFNKQTGDASKAHALAGRIRIDRHTELPAGALRVAPIETSTNGVIVVPAARFGTAQAKDVRLVIRDGVVRESSASASADAVKAFLASEPGASHFREFALGFNPKLVIPPGERALPYYGYGAGVVRMSLGDNSELGGAVRGGGVRWFFFADATVTVGGMTLVERGRLLQ